MMKLKSLFLHNESKIAVYYLQLKDCLAQFTSILKFYPAAFINYPNIKNYCIYKLQ
jgi:hypothetical protein